MSMKERAALMSPYTDSAAWCLMKHSQIAADGMPQIEARAGIGHADWRRAWFCLRSALGKPLVWWGRNCLAGEQPVRAGASRAKIGLCGQPSPFISRTGAFCLGPGQPHRQVESLQESRTHLRADHLGRLAVNW